MDKDLTKQAVREAKYRVATEVKTDWEWPSTSPTADAADAASHLAGLDLSDQEHFRERYYSDGPSTTETSPVRVSSQQDAVTPRKHRKSGSGSYFSAKSSRQSEEYTFESPDTVGITVDMKRTKRVRRRNARLRDEMEWNEGLRNWMARRDAWTGAVNPMGASMQAQYARHSPNSPDTDVGHAGSSTSDPAPSATKPEPEEKPSADDTEEGEASNSEHTLVDSHAPLPEDDPTLDSALIPVAPPFLPQTNPVRRAIGPKTYDEIYEKTVVTACAPSVPINLADMTRACVYGWQKHGVWSAAAAQGQNTTTITAGNPMPANDGRSLLERMMGASSKKKRDHVAMRSRETRDAKRSEVVAARQKSDGGGASGNGGSGGPSGLVVDEADGRGIFGKHPHVRASVEGVKKVFRLSGGPHNLPPPEALDEEAGKDKG